MTNICVGTQRDKEVTVPLNACHVNLYVNIACRNAYTRSADTCTVSSHTNFRISQQSTALDFHIQDHTFGR